MHLLGLRFPTNTVCCLEFFWCGDWSAPPPLLKSLVGGTYQALPFSSSVTSVRTLCVTVLCVMECLLLLRLRCLATFVFCPRTTLVPTRVDEMHPEEPLPLGPLPHPTLRVEDGQVEREEVKVVRTFPSRQSSGSSTSRTSLRRN